MKKKTFVILIIFLMFFSNLSSVLQTFVRANEDSENISNKPSTEIPNKVLTKIQTIDIDENTSPKKGNETEKEYINKNESQENGQDKVTICHIPQGNPENAQEITVGEPALSTHLAHGDYLGFCDEIPPDGSIEFLDESNQIVEFSNDLNKIGVLYQAEDKQEEGSWTSGMKEVIFGIDGQNWQTIEDLELDTRCIGQNSPCNFWDGNEIRLPLFKNYTDDEDINPYFDIELMKEGLVERYMVLVDSAGNSNMVSSNFIYDKTKPNKNVLLEFLEASPTKSLSNTIRYSIEDTLVPTDNSSLKLLESEISGIEKIRFSNDGINWTEWENYTGEEKTKSWNWDENFLIHSPGKIIGTLIVYMQGIDRAKNMSDIFSTQIQFYDSESIPPEINLRLENEYVNSLDQKFLMVSALDRSENNIDASEVKGIRFSLNEVDWITLTNMERMNCPESSFECNAWDGEEISVELSNISSNIHEGRNNIYIEVYDGNGNKTYSSVSFVFDSKITKEANLIIGNFENDVSNPENTNSFVNYYSYSAKDFEENGIENSGLNGIRFSEDNQNWTEWEDLNEDAMYSLSKTFQNHFGKFEIYMQVKDRAGNVSNSFYDSIFFEKPDTTAPQGEILIINNEGNILKTTNNTNNLQIKVSAEDMNNTLNEGSGIATIRFSTDGYNWKIIDSLNTISCPQNNKNTLQETCNEWDGSTLYIPLFEVVDSIYEGRIRIFAEISDHEGNVIIIDTSFVYDVTSPEQNGSFWIGREPYDWSNPDVTDSRTNYFVYEVYDSTTSILDPEILLGQDDVSGIGYVRFSNLSGYQTNWIEYSGEGLDSYETKWTPYTIFGQPYFAYMEVKDNAGNIGTYTYSDSILYQTSIRTNISIQINNDDEYTNIPIYALKVVPAFTYSPYPLEKIRFKYCNKTCTEDDEWSNWKNFSEFYIDIFKDSTVSGRKTVYAQASNSMGLTSLEVYDNIIFDNDAPNIQGIDYTSYPNYQRVKVYADDKNSDNTNGIGIKDYSIFVNSGEWTDWEEWGIRTYKEIYAYKSDPNEKITNFCIKIRDNFDNETETYCEDLEDKSLTGSEKADNEESGSSAIDGKILINNGDIFTNSREVKVYVEANEGYQNRTQVENYYLWDDALGRTIENKHAYSGPITLDFTLGEEFGLKRVNVRFDMPNASAAYGYDEIVYSPRYWVEYSDIKFLGENSEEIERPIELLAGSDQKLSLDLLNNGSETWHNNDFSDPVNLSYHWYRIEDGVEVQYLWNGDRTSLEGNVSYGNSVDDAMMNVHMPYIEGEYVLKIDMVHEGVTWFSEVANDMPEFEFTILDNPDLPVLTGEESGQVLGEYSGEYGIGELSCSEIFTDVCGDSFLKYIKNLYYDDVIDGTDQIDTDPKTFSPGYGMQRGQFAMWLVIAFDFEINSEGKMFSDSNTEAETPYLYYIQTIKNLGITMGFSDGTYKPSNIITRAEMATMTVKAMGVKGMVFDYSLWHPFEDMYNSGHEPFVAIITNTVVNGERIMSGENYDYFGGANNATRGQTTKVLDLARQFVPKDGIGTVVNINGIDLYREPGELSDIVGKLPYTDQVQILLQREVAGEIWLFVKGSSGIQGWTRSDNVFIPVGYEYPVDENFNMFESATICNDSEIGMYELPNWGSRLLKLLPRHTNMNVIEVDGDWRKVILVGRITGTGWVHKAYVCEGYTQGPEPWGLLGFVAPYDGIAPLESLFGPREGGFHYGTDYGMECNSPLYATQEGIVINMSDNGENLGNNSTPETPVSFVVLEHDNGYISFYYHLNEVFVSVGDRVSRGELIGLSGNTGYLRGDTDDPIESQGCHLHFEIHEINDDSTDIWASLFARNPIEVLREIVSPELKAWIEELKERFFNSDMEDPEIINNLVDYGIGEATLGNSEDPYAGLTINEFSDPVLNVKLDYATKEYYIYPNIEAPILTYSETDDDGNVKIYGIAIPKNLRLVVNMDVEFSNNFEAQKACNVGLHISSEEYDCMARYMGYSSYKDWTNLFTSQCAIYDIACKYKILTGSRTEEYTKLLNVQNVLITFYKKDGTYIGQLWNDSIDGRFVYEAILGDNIIPEDEIHAKVNIFGDFTTKNMIIDYRGNTNESAKLNKGISSINSNSIEVEPKPSEILNYSVNPLGDPTCAGAYRSSPYGNRIDPFTGELKFHNGIDFALEDGGSCIIQTVYKGDFKHTGGWGTTGRTIHNDIFTSVYGHASSYIADEEWVDTGDDIENMGNTGASTGIHLHLTLLKEGSYVNPDNYISDLIN